MYRIMPALFLGLSAASASTAADPHQLDKTHADLLFSISHAGFTEKHGFFLRPRRYTAIRCRASGKESGRGYSKDGLHRHGFRSA